jgi:methionyl-tRNA synthetase
LNSSVPHIGHLYSLVTADLFARYRYLVNPSTQVNFLAGTDEHGLKIQQAAQAQNLAPQEFCDGISERFKVRRIILQFYHRSHATFK